MQPGNLGSALVFAVLPAAVLLAVIYWLDRYEKEPGRLLAIALGLGAVVAPLVAFLIEKAAGVPSSLAAQSVVPKSRLSPWTPLIAELATGAAVLVTILLVRYEIDDLLDGLIYGAVVGVGFGLAANFIAILSTKPLGGDASASLFTTMVAGLNHVLYGAVIGLIIAVFRRGATGGLVIGALVGSAVAFGLAILHDYLPWWLAGSANATSGSSLSGVLAEIPTYLGLVVLAALAAWALYREGEIVGRELHDEVGRSITEEEYDIVTNPFRRFGVMTRAIYTGGPDFGPRRRLYSTAVELAFRKHHRNTDRVAARQWLDEDVYRQRLAETRGELNQVLEQASRRRTAA